MPIIDDPPLHPCVAGYFPELPAVAAATVGYIMPPTFPRPRLDAPKPAAAWISGPPESLVDREFGLLKVREQTNAFASGDSRGRYMCICEPCGRRVTATSSELLNGKFKTCGSVYCRAVLRRRSKENGSQGV